jgi:hypothetical protein
VKALSIKRDIQPVVDRINRTFNMPLAPYTKGADGKFTANIGNFHLSQAYGGVCLHRMVGEGGGVTDVLSCGHVPKRELQTAMFAFLRGIELKEEHATCALCGQRFPAHSGPCGCGFRAEGARS